MFNLCTEVFLRSTVKHFWDGLSHYKALPYSEVTDGLSFSARKSYRPFDGNKVFM